MLSRSRLAFTSSLLRRQTATRATRVQHQHAQKWSSASTVYSLSSASSSTLFVATRSVTQVHSNMETNPSRRDQESFLAQYNPMEVLGLYEGVSDMNQVMKSYETKKKEHMGDKVMTERLDRAFNIVTDPKSPYYERLTWQQGYRQKLMVELLPKEQRRVAKFYAYFWGTIGVIGMFAMVYAFIHPVLKIWRAATR